MTSLVNSITGSLKILIRNLTPLLPDQESMMIRLLPQHQIISTFIPFKGL
jgi:hypothetical protein